VNHLTDDQLSAYMDGALKGRDAEAFGRHIAACQPCREALAELAAQDEALRPALGHDPGEEYFERFAARVDERIDATGAAGARPRGAGFDLGRFFGSPRALAWAGGVAVVVVGAGLALMAGREVVPPDLRDRDLAARVEREAPGGAKPVAPPTASPEVPVPSPPDASPTAEGAPDGALPEAVPPPTDAPARNERADAAPGRQGAALDAQDRLGAVGAPLSKEESARLGERERRLAPPVVGAPERKDGPAPAPQAAPPVASAPADARAAAPSRAREVRQTPSGEEAAVPRVGEARSAPAPAPAAGADQATRVRKRLAAEPLEAARKSAATPGLASAPPPAGVPSADLAAPAEVRLCGVVRDAAGRAVAGAQVAVSDLGRSVTSDAAGRFCVVVPRGEHTLSVMAVGYTESRRTVRADGGEPELDVTLAAVPVFEEKALTLGGRGAPERARAAALPEPRDAYSALPDTLRRLVREAQRLEADARARRSAGHYDLAASAWERALRRLMDGPFEIETRGHLAETRFRAWDLGRNGRRARAAVEALTAYASRAPAGPGRDQAARWLDQVRP
jgi:hypothetical protein